MGDINQDRLQDFQELNLTKQQDKMNTVSLFLLQATDVQYY